MNLEVKEYLEQIREPYKTWSYSEIVDMGWITKESIELNGKKHHPAIWGEEFQDQALLVVQLTRWYFLKIFGATDCIGFLMNGDGTITNVDAYWLMHEVGHP